MITHVFKTYQNLLFFFKTIYVLISASSPNTTRISIISVAVGFIFLMMLISLCLVCLYLVNKSRNIASPSQSIQEPLQVMPRLGDVQLQPKPPESFAFQSYNQHTGLELFQQQNGWPLSETVR